MEFYNKPDDGRQHNRQSKDFKEIWNVQTDMKVKALKWDRIFHNWENPAECKGKQRITGCKICDMIEKGEPVEHLKPNKEDN